MGEQEDKEKAEKLAAAKKRVAQLKKKKAGVGVSAGDKATTSIEKKQAAVLPGDKEVGDLNDGETEAQPADPSRVKDPQQQNQEGVQNVRVDDKLEVHEDNPDEVVFNEAIKTAQAGETSQDEEFRLPSRKHQARQASISIQSKLRSTSFRQSHPLSPSHPPEDGSDDSLYRKQSTRIEDLEKENARLTKAADEGETRWRRSEEELEDLREKALAHEDRSDELEKLRNEISSLRRSSRASVSGNASKSRDQNAVAQHEDLEGLKRELESKDSTISDLQIELSRLRSRVSAQAEGCETHGEQIAALQLSVEKAESTVKRLEAELKDTKKALTCASEKAVIDGTEKMSSQTKLRALEKENEEFRQSEAELLKKTEALEKKVETMTKLHRDTEQRNNNKISNLEAQAKEAQLLRPKFESLEREIVRLKEARKQAMSGDGGDDGLEELEEEERRRLERHVRELEAEVFELKRGVWRDKRKELQPGMVEDGVDEFDDIDLSGSGALSRRRSTASQGPGRQHSGFTQVLNSGLAAFRSSTMSPDSQQRTRPRNDSLLQDFDDDTFDEHEFARLQKEEEMKKMIEHIREVKRGLRKWAGWRLDLVDARRGGGGWGVGEVFSV